MKWIPNLVTFHFVDRLLCINPPISYFCLVLMTICDINTELLTKIPLIWTAFPEYHSRLTFLSLVWDVIHDLDLVRRIIFANPVPSPLISWQNGFANPKNSLVSQWLQQLYNQPWSGAPLEVVITNLLEQSWTAEDCLTVTKKYWKCLSKRNWERLRECG